VELNLDQFAYNNYANNIVKFIFLFDFKEQITNCKHVNSYN